ncbi:restriction endonuclease subunit S [Marinimicrobium sp. C2-29]|uniref:restriction endonuclease subunit S n=1 Tax=Marinimicrobium sp. C2-29 TaxID=3139825 RepID=UPI003139D0DF
MSEWRSLPIRECLVSHFAGEWGDDPTPANVQVLRATNVSDKMTVDVEGGAHRKIAAKKLDEKQLLSGDIILEASGGSTEKPVGRVAFFEAELTQKFVVSNFFRTLRPNRAVVYPRFLCLLLHWFYAQPPIKAMQQQTTGIINLKLEQYLGYQVDIPVDVKEQKTIANILDTLDTQIRQTEAIIAKLQQVKQGLLHDLLTRGIDANGQLRPTRNQAPELYKESPQGWIPREWEFKPLMNFLVRTTYGFTSPMPTTEEGPWMVTAADVSDGSINYTTARKTSTRAFDLLSEKSKPKIGDVLITKDGTLGRVAVVDSDNVCVNQSVAVMQPLPDTDADYIQTYLRSPVGQERILADAGGSTIKHIYITVLEKMLLPIPSAEEAARICRSSSGLNTRLQKENEKYEKLKKQKSGLMDDLLTGRVRVTSLLDTAKAS